MGMPFEKAIDDGWQLYESTYDRQEGWTAFCLDCVRNLGLSLDP